MIGGNYSSKTLNDNWFEDRHQPPKEPFKTWALPDDGFERYKISKTREEFPHPRSRTEVVFSPPKKTSFINTETIPEVCYPSRRPMNDIPGSGFRAVLSRHPPNVNERSFTTAAREANSSAPVTEVLDLKEIAAGLPGIKEAKEQESALVGENVKLCNIPVQRSWMSEPDPGLREYLKSGGKIPPLPEKDNELSLDIGRGAQALIMETLKSRGGKLYRTKTSITTGKEGKDGISIFDDYP